MQIFNIWRPFTAATAGPMTDRRAFTVSSCPPYTPFSRRNFWPNDLHIWNAAAMLCSER